MTDVVSVVMGGPLGGSMRVTKWIWKNRTLAIGVFVVITAVKIHRTMKKRQRRLQWAKAGKDVVVIHCIGPGIYTPSVSPFVMKLATYLRLAQIPHQVSHR
ncbi:hypothetical protein SK128_025595 [Halocaridina rubra]|uniref:Uncharacterized protein n=1 Tax=Halocaridina rubra TaxID=373956 RepID=A0AAN8X1S3_HALRR